ncbi:glucans biosynthesis protein [Tistlia consotensis]|uniref:Glucans biosynthesis protein n=2 Tax=Tistlia TaxID=1321364 RepID=A0A1Y6CQM3_9PROT|nr:glucans biosynthesis protein [Tistlia consotensis USBA 355]SNS27663.1 glucans biosynthesis protein [Tistlia consotensis]
MTLSRRALLAGSAAVTFVSTLAGRSLAQSATSGTTSGTVQTAGPRLGDPVPFDRSALVDRARALAGEAYEAPEPRAAEALDKIDYDAYNELKYKASRALWQGEVRYPVQFFHLGRYFKLPVTVYEVEGAVARKVLYDPSLFDYGNTGLADKLPDDLGFAGFRYMNPGEPPTDWLVFLGAAYFRTAGPFGQYGLSARGIAINTATDAREEFPRFSEFWLEKPAADSREVTIHALLEGRSVVGVYSFKARNENGVVMDVDSTIFLRREVERLGIAPLTSMFWFSETNRQVATDWRPEIHDSDGLSLWTGAGERIWRPLNNPKRLQVNAFVDQNPRGFGLMQRDRDFRDYEDDGVFYDRRPSLWVEPVGEWGEGAVELIEIPTDDEIHDNIVAFWRPKAMPKVGQPLSMSYKLYWVADQPFPAKDVGRVLATRMGRGGVPGQPRPKDLRKFVIDFAGGPLPNLDKGTPVEAVVAASRGEIVNKYCLRVVGTDRWRAVFDLKADGSDPVDLRLYLRLGEKTLTETWLYQYLPFTYPSE